MSVRVMTSVWEVALPDSEKLVLLALADCANDEGSCWPSMRTLAEKCSKSDRTVQAAIKALVAKGHLSRIEKPGKGCNYHVHPVPNKQATPEEAAPRKDCAPKPLPVTPETVAGHPRSGFGQTVKNHQEPSKDSPPAGAFSFDDFQESWNAVAKECGLSLMVKPTAERRQAFRVRKRQYPDIADWQSAFRCLRTTKWMHGDNDRKWRADPEFFLRAKCFTKLVEGSYAEAD